MFDYNKPVKFRCYPYPDHIVATRLPGETKAALFTNSLDKEEVIICLDCCCLSDAFKSPWDIINVPEKRELWLNIYPNTYLIGAYETRTDADNWASSDRIACVRVEYTEGEGLEP